MDRSSSTYHISFFIITTFFGTHWMCIAKVISTDSVFGENLHSEQTLFSLRWRYVASP